MKKTLAFPLVLAASLGLVACSESATTEADTNAVNDMEAAVEEAANDTEAAMDEMTNDVDAMADDAMNEADDMADDMGDTAENAM
ncbi:MAG: circumsporozoite protein [Sphingomonadaceae bacterium]|nr:circumsporozoite protein [Sphingomonadaceae bacterium]